MKPENIFIAGHEGMVGSAIYNDLKKLKKKIYTIKKKKLNLLNQEKIFNYLKKNKINQIYICAARVGGIYANSKYPANFIYENIVLTTNIIHAAHILGIKKIMYLGSSCMYPKITNRPICENDLLNGSPEKTNEFYSIAKISGTKLAQSYNKQYGMDIRCIIPNNLYGYNDKYHHMNSHVVPALIKKIYNAKKHNKKSISLWGTGKPKRELLFISDLSSFVIKIMSISQRFFYSLTEGDYLINVGSGQEYSIKELSKIISKVVGYKGQIKFDLNKMDGVKRKLLDTSRQRKLNLNPKINLKSGLELTLEDYKKQIKFK